MNQKRSEDEVDRAAPRTSLRLVLSRADSQMQEVESEVVEHKDKFEVKEDVADKDVEVSSLILLALFATVLLMKLLEGEKTLPMITLAVTFLYLESR